MQQNRAWIQKVNTYFYLIGILSLTLLRLLFLCFSAKLNWFCDGEHAHCRRMRVNSLGLLNIGIGDYRNTTARRFGLRKIPFQISLTCFTFCVSFDVNVNKTSWFITTNLISIGILSTFLVFFKLHCFSIFIRQNLASF